MISVFFRCACPYVGYTLKQADYTKGEMRDCTPAQMTRTGHRLLHSSGSYLVLGRFEGKKYFHIRQSKSTALDEQGRQIYTNLALVGDTAADERVINRIAGYALLDEDRFYREIASMMILLDADFTVDFEALKAFLDRFSRSYQVKTSNPRLKEFCRSVIFASTCNEIDFIVAEADWSYFVKQVGEPFQMPPYCFTYREAKDLADTARLIFPEVEEPGDAPVQSREAEVPVPETPEQKPVEKPIEKPVEKPEPNRAEQELEQLKAQMDALRQADARKEQEKQAIETEKGMLRTQLSKAEEKLAEMTSELRQLKEKLKNYFLFGILAGVIGAILAVLIFGQISACTMKKPAQANRPVESAAVQMMEIERGDYYAG